MTFFIKNMQISIGELQNIKHIELATNNSKTVNMYLHKIMLIVIFVTKNLNKIITKIDNFSKNH